MTPGPSSVKDGANHAVFDSNVPGQIRLGTSLTAGMSEEVEIGLIGQPRARLKGRILGLS